MGKYYKEFTNSGAPHVRGVSQRPIGGQYRIGMTDLSMDSLWDPEAEKYKVFCRMVHVTKATLHITYIQLIITFVFLMFFTYYYIMAMTGNLAVQHWFSTYYASYTPISQLVLALLLQFTMGVAVIHGVQTERRSLLLPYIIYTSLAILAGCAQILNDFSNLEQINQAKHSILGTNINRNAANSQFIRQLIGIMIFSWCLSVVWRCYGYLGDKKIACRIGEQLSATQAAFHYPAEAQLLNYYPIATHNMPPPYADTVLPATQAPAYVAAPPSKPIVILDPPQELPKVEENTFKDASIV